MAPRQTVRGALALLLVTSCPACLSGWLYTDITEPVVIDMNSTPVADHAASLSNYEVRFRSVSWADVQSRAIGDAATSNGLERARYADLRTFSVFGGLFKRRTIEVWGK